MAEKKEDFLSVTEFRDLVNKTVASLGTVKVVGELSGIRSISTGTTFFKLVQEIDGIRYAAKCVMFGSRASNFSHLMEEGLEVVVTGTTQLHTSGEFNILTSYIEPHGEGALRRAMEALKKELSSKGYFKDENKKVVPVIIKKIGLITSETGDAIHDFRKNLGTHGFVINFISVRVEGITAVRGISSAIRWFNRNIPDTDVLVIVRGGGGLENLKTFNSKAVADAIFLSRLPIITGIGHERDETIADLTADMSFSAPSAVGIFIKTTREKLIDSIEEYLESLENLMNETIQNSRELVAGYGTNLEYALSVILQNYKMLILKLAEKLHRGLEKVFSTFRMLENKIVRLLDRYVSDARDNSNRVDTHVQSIANAMGNLHKTTLLKVEQADARLTDLNPEFILKRGYSILYNKNKKVIKKPGDTNIGEEAIAKLHKGRLTLKVEKADN